MRYRKVRGHFVQLFKSIKDFFMVLYGFKKLNLTEKI